ncbi:MAG: heme-binding protein [Chromatiales bacterium]|nr:heme-binding protein [Chromatiales bacterium]
MAIEEPDYEVISRNDDYEVRGYAAFNVAEVELPASSDNVDNQAFRILAGYIFGKNRSRARIGASGSLESDVDNESIKMAMTAPVISADSDVGDNNAVIAFVMERKFSLDELPEPIDPRIRLRRQPPRVMAVREYSGRWTPENFQENKDSLLQALERDGVSTRGPAILARYNSPFTPWFLRRNEVMIQVEPD